MTSFIQVFLTKNMWWSKINVKNMNNQILTKLFNKWAVIDEKTNKIISVSKSYAEAYKKANVSKLKTLYIKFIAAPDTIISPNAEN